MEFIEFDMECAMNAHDSKAEYEGILSELRLYKALRRNMRHSLSDVKPLAATLSSKNRRRSSQSANNAAEAGKVQDGDRVQTGMTANFL